MTSELPTRNPANFPEKQGNRYALDDAEVVSRYLAGESEPAIAASLGVSRIVIKHRIDEAGIAHRGRRHDLPDDEIARRYLAGESENALSVLLGVSRSAVRRRLVEAEIEIRNPLSANRLMAAGRSPEQNKALTEAAHLASRGRKATEAERVARALTRQARRSGIGAYEELLAVWLRERGIDAIPQQAVGPYNVDLGAFPVAVEIFGGHWHLGGRHAARAAERFRYLFDAGWHLMVVWIDRRQHPLTIAAADQVVSFVQFSRSNPAAPRQKRVIWGDGNPVSAGFNLDDSAPVPSVG